MNSRVEMHQRNRRIFGRVAMLASMLAFALIAFEFAIPPEPSPYGASPGPDLTAFNLHDLQLLLLVSALVVSVASLVGFGIATLAAWVTRREEHEGHRPPSTDGHRTKADKASEASKRSKKVEPRLTREPANARIAALRAVVSPAEKAPRAEA